MKAISAEQQLPSQKVQHSTARIISTFICSHFTDSSFAGPRKRLLLTHNNGDFGAISACNGTKHRPADCESRIDAVPHFDLV